jgi:hypothetical protein
MSGVRGKAAIAQVEVNAGTSGQALADGDAAWWPHCAAAWYEPVGPSLSSPSASCPETKSVISPLHLHSPNRRHTVPPLRSLVT